MNSTPLRIINTLAFLLMIVTNALANIIPLGHGNTGSISAKYPNLFTPAPVTFSIWGLIYLFMAFFILYQWGVLGAKGYAASDVKTIGLWFLLSCFFNIAWIFTWHYEKILLSTICMLCLLITLCIIVVKADASTRNLFGDLSIRIGFGLYLGWICAATIANISVLLVSINWNGFGLSPVIWTIIAVTAGTLIGILLTIFGHRYPATCALIWAYAGILNKHVSVAGYSGRYPGIIAATIAGITAMLCAMMITVIGTRH